MRNKVIITSEQVGRGHPDKIADQISDAILTMALKIDENSRVAIETAVGKEIVFITGEITTKAKIDIEKIAKKILIKIDVDYKNFKIIVNVSKQSFEISKAVDKKELGAGDQGLMYGYATNETKRLLPIPFALVTDIIVSYEKEYASRDGKYKYDSKAQVTYDYNRHKIININLSVQHSKNLSLEKLRKEMKKMIIKTIKRFEKENKLQNLLNNDTEIIINNAGTFIVGGAFSDAGVTGRKIIADTYGGWGRHGGGAFSGKDYTKVDRSAAYYARYVATQVIKNGLAEIIEIQVSYIIGKPKPIAINFETFETEKKNNVNLKEIRKFIDGFDFGLNNIIKELNLKKINYSKTTLYGHFGKKEFKWG